ncbi:DUF1810 domain-containing protein [Pseudomonas sp. KNUC1026]|uniref:DUF1810 domain-containing protein n=1 Tax=Pseudomonas sp. KNUC1026 TaxID=2893890 RepID=UPI001F247DA7|nr:DUF1810 domain-containing protein [Pseudomonas sp. KNUC1026]UFH50499.1 DUF1810 domain-containing protein [Pseudomonas sp. KNUC1026]
MNDPFNLSRFIEAQRPILSRFMDELQAGHKTSHWMWYVFPQLKGLGSSETAMQFGINDLHEARAYLEHPVLGSRLVECVQALLKHRELSALQILGSPDDLKLRSCLTLFNEAHPESALFQQALDQFYSGKSDERTLQLLRERMS